MLIKSRDHLIGHTYSLLERAQHNLRKDGNLVSAVIYESYECLRMDACLGELPNTFVTDHIRGVLKHHPDIEVVTFISLAYGVKPEEFERLPTRPADHPNRRTMIGAECSHPDFGYIRLHTEYTEDSAGFHFKPISRSTPTTEKPPADSFLIDLWPKRKLNS